MDDLNLDSISNESLHSIVGQASAELLKRIEMYKRLMTNYKDTGEQLQGDQKQLAASNEGLRREVERLRAALLDVQRVKKERGELAGYWQNKYKGLLVSGRPYIYYDAGKEDFDEALDDMFMNGELGSLDTAEFWESPGVVSRAKALFAEQMADESIAIAKHSIRAALEEAEKEAESETAEVKAE